MRELKITQQSWISKGAEGNEAGGNEREMCLGTSSGNLAYLNGSLMYGERLLVDRQTRTPKSQHPPNRHWTWTQSFTDLTISSTPRVFG